MLGVLGRVGTGVGWKQKPAPRDLKGGHLSLANSGRGLHPAASPPRLLHAHPGSGQAGVDLKGTHVSAGPAHPTPQCADQGRRGILYLQP